MRVRKVHWLASYPKSGNTWVRLFLNAYAHGEVDINRIQTTLSDIDAFEYQGVSNISVQDMESDLEVSFRHAALVNQAVKSNKTPTLFKTHHKNGCINHIELIPRYLTTSAVYLIRDPRAICASLAKHLGKTQEHISKIMSDDNFALRRDGFGVTHFLGNWSDHVKSWEAAKFPCTIIRYEDLLSDPVEHFSKILETLNIEVIERKVEQAIELCRLEKLKAQEEKFGFLEKTEHQDRFFGEPDKLSPDLAEIIEQDHETVMQRYYLDKVKKIA